MYLHCLKGIKILYGGIFIMMFLKLYTKKHSLEKFFFAWYPVPFLQFANNEQGMVGRALCYHVRHFYQLCPIFGFVITYNVWFIFKLMCTYKCDHYNFLQNRYDVIWKGLKLLPSHVHLKNNCGSFAFLMSQQLTIKRKTVTLNKHSIQ